MVNGGSDHYYYSGGGVQRKRGQLHHIYPAINEKGKGGKPFLWENVSSNWGFFIGAQRLNKNKPRDGSFVKFPQNIHFSFA